MDMNENSPRFILFIDSAVKLANIFPENDNDVNDIFCSMPVNFSRQMDFTAILPDSFVKLLSHMNVKIKCR